MKMLMRVAAVAAAVTISAGTAHAQNCGVNATSTAGAAATICTVTVNASATVNDVMTLTLTTTTLGLGTPLQADYVAGYKNATNLVNAAVVSNRPYKVTIVAASANFSYADGGSGLSNPNKPASDLLWGLDGSSYGNNAGASAELMSGTSGTSGANQDSHFRTQWSFGPTGQPGVYSIVLNYTLSTP